MKRFCISVLLASAIACSGDDGEAGSSVLLREIAEAPGANCERGGLRLASGVDTNGNGQLDDDEISTSAYDCNASSCDLRPYANCAGADLRNVSALSIDLQGANFRGADLRGALFGASAAQFADFTGARLDDAVFFGVGLNGASFRDASLKHAGFVSRTDLTDADLTGADLTGSVFAEVFLNDAKADNVRLVEAMVLAVEMRNVSFVGADFSGTAFAPGTRFEGGTVANAKFAGTQLSSATFAGVDFSGADLSFASLFAAELAQSNVGSAAAFTNAYLDLTAITVPEGVDLKARGAIDLNDVDHSGRDFSRAHVPQNFSFDGKTLSNASFAGTLLDGVSMNNVTAVGTNFTGATLGSASRAGANFTNANFTDADISGAFDSSTNLTGANFTHAGLTGVVCAGEIGGANFTQATLINAAFTGAMTAPATWTGAYYSTLTQFPAAVAPAPTEAVRFEPGAALAGKDLSYIRSDMFAFSDADDLTGTIFNHAVLRVDFDGAKLAGANFTNARLVGSRFERSDLTGATFTGADLRFCSFGSANGSGANFTDASLRCSELGYGDSDLSPMVVTNATWSNTVCPVGRNSSETKSGTCDGFLIFGVTPSGTPLEQISCRLALITQP